MSRMHKFVDTVSDFLTIKMSTVSLGGVSLNGNVFLYVHYLKFCLRGKILKNRSPMKERRTFGYVVTDRHDTSIR